ncbi:4-(cytidine 5'-diphospho)-2-C-methyl-D-erythritol kinase [Psychromarinibacter sp. S121]|uniref:4-(cytidine 5'-diphospho)-2-C-methyl-D-erythritol kinase n=1 Tax=Psychromarinibacter sp. S121 TaxID=3415127 RepID=UPI003C7B42EC
MADAGFAPAKVNLTLHVTGRRDDGYHLLDSLVVFADIGDLLEVFPSDRPSLRVSGPMAKGVPVDDSNLVLRAAQAMGLSDIGFHLQKHLPAAAGIGGGSSDAAAALRLLAEVSGAPLPADRGLSLGADVPVCLAAEPARMSGIGERVDPLPPLPPFGMVLANPGVSVPTGAVFAALSSRDNAPMPADLPNWPDARAFARWLGEQRNDMEGPARGIAPAIGVTLSRLGATDGCLLARMSGSGATCFALYETLTEAEAAASVLADLHPDWWIAAAAPYSASAA